MSVQTNNYASPICEYCPCTDFGSKPVCTGSWNMCDGRCCTEALDNYNDGRDEEDRIASIEDAF